MAQLIMRRGPQPGKTYELTEKNMQIGRGRRNDIIIEDNEVSREHCRLVKENDWYEIYDLDSSNGTYVNGQKVIDSWVLQGDSIIELGDSITFEFKMSAGDTPESGVPLDSQNIPLVQTFLIVTNSNQKSKAIYPLHGDDITIGRGTNNNVIIVEPELSRNHMRLTRTSNGYQIQDLGSTNGTSVNGTPLSGTHLLVTGDVIRVGTTITMQFTTDPDEILFDKRSTATLSSDKATDASRPKRTKILGITTILDAPPEPTQVGTGFEPDALAEQVMIVYARDDWEKVVAPMVDHLYQSNIPTWVEQYLAPGGDDWYVAIEQARLECWMLVVVISPEAMKSDHVMKIWRHFHNREKPVILIMHEQVERLPIGAKRAQKIQYIADQPEVCFRQLVQAIKMLKK